MCKSGAANACAQDANLHVVNFQAQAQAHPLTTDRKQRGFLRGLSFRLLFEDNRSNENGRTGDVPMRRSLSSHFLSCREKLRTKHPCVRRFTRWNWTEKIPGKFGIRGQTIEGIRVSARNRLPGTRTKFTFGELTNWRVQKTNVASLNEADGKKALTQFVFQARFVPGLRRRFVFFSGRVSRSTFETFRSSSCFLPFSIRGDCIGQKSKKHRSSRFALFSRQNLPPCPIWRYFL